jgi:hypothetical protein
MTALTAVLLLALGNDAGNHYPGASPVFQCTFEASGDEDFSVWPPGWTRRHGPGFPRYVRMQLDQNHPVIGGGSLRVELDGGAATAYGPSVAASPNLQYVLEGYVETSGLSHDAAYLSLIFLDAKRKTISTVASEKMSGSKPWQKVCLGPVLPPAEATSMIVGLHVEPRGEAEDFHGTAAFGGLWLAHLPHVALSAEPGRETVPDQVSGGGDSAARKSHDEKPLAVRSAGEAKFLIFPLGQPIKIACAVSGYEVSKYDIHLQLLDVDGHVIAEHRQSFQGAAGSGTLRGPSPTATRNVPDTKPPFARTAWQLPNGGAGYYRVRAVVEPKPNANTHYPASPPAELAFAVVEPQPLPCRGEFGWSLGPHDADLGLIPLSDLLAQSGIHWVKFPFGVKEAVAAPAESGDKAPAAKSAAKAVKAAESYMQLLINFSDRLERAGVKMVGLLQPPRVSQEIRNVGQVANLPEMLAAETFALDPMTWYPSIEPILARLATQIRSWQIGGDRDNSWAGCRDLSGVVARSKAQLDRIGQDLDVGIAWNLNGPLPIATNNVSGTRRVPTPESGSRNAPSAGGSRSVPPSLTPDKAAKPKTPWRFLSMPCDASLGNDAIAHALDNTKSAGIARWVVLETLPREGHPPSERIAHLVDRVVTAKMHGAEAIFVADPLDPERGLIARTGSPSELFLPWRTTALALGGTTYAGDLDLPRGNQIHCFGGNGQYVGLINGGKPGKDWVYLGPELRMLDIWGNRRACPPTISTDGSAGRTGLAQAPGETLPPGRVPSGWPAQQSVVDVQATPTFLTELNGPITQWQLDAAFSPDRLPSIPSAVVPLTLELRNSFPCPVSGQVSIHMPKNWYLEPRTAEFRIEPGAPWKQRLEVALPNDVLGGRQLVRLEFAIQADRLYRFTMYRPLTVTLGDVMFEGRAALNQRGEIEVRQTMINTGKTAAAFRCDLLAPDRQRQSSEVVIPPTGKIDLQYHLGDGEQLVGKAIWLRAEEINGPHVLNFRIEVPTASAPPQTPPPRPPSRAGARVGL